VAADDAAAVCCLPASGLQSCLQLTPPVVPTHAVPDEHLGTVEPQPVISMETMKEVPRRSWRMVSASQQAVRHALQTSESMRVDSG
jgi:hypothetical protein